jgi:EKC/KEOPS complex subunit PCC1/LAGE3
MHQPSIPHHLPEYKAMTTPLDPDFPCSLYVASLKSLALKNITDSATNSTIDLPLPTARLASAALQALQVDKELSPLVRRSFSTISPTTSTTSKKGNTEEATGHSSAETVLRTEYKATTNRMLRVAVNGFMESLSVILGVMEELDVDVLGVQTANG